MRVSLPVILNEPLSGLQRACELEGLGHPMFEKAAKLDDSIMRASLYCVGLFTGFSSTRVRKRKPFNAMLGETFEYVSQEFRYFAEKVSHTPEQVVCSCLEGKNYIMTSYNKPKPTFSFGGGKGAVSFPPFGLFDVYFKNHDENISITKGTIWAKNIIFGGLYVDIGGSVECLNHKTKEKVKINFIEKKGDQSSYIEGHGYDAMGNIVTDISGTWLSEIFIKDRRTGKKELVWEEGPLLPDAHMNYYFNHLAVKLNQRVDGMKGVVAPTDSRWRDDIKYYEEGDADQADKVKFDIEEEQRRKRKLQEAGELKIEPNFFE